MFGSIRTIVDALSQREGASPPVLRPVAFYAYTDDDRGLCANALQFLSGNPRLSLEDPPTGNLSIRISDKLADMAGPVAGLELAARLRDEDAVLFGASSVEGSTFTTLISAGDAAVFVRFLHEGIPVFFCTSSHMVDINLPVSQGFYDVKDHFCSAVPLIMSIRFLFPEVVWQPQELGACLIIDDPLLKPRYGFCNFPKLASLMREHGFTTNIAFIPWNWRRTTLAAARFFKGASGSFSISIHGCDHTEGEFGATSLDTLQTRAQLARSRMQKHEARTGIQHDSIMVFPQGVFSSYCPTVLKQNGYLAAVNTEIVPVDSQNARTRIRDIWDVAIMAYGDFPIFTRRYASHGLENFAFDLLLGKPCLIVAHHDDFKDGGAAMIDLIERISSLHCRLQWRPLGQVIRRACRRRSSGAGSEEVVMYGNELVIGNSSRQTTEVKIHKRISQDDSVSEILCDEKALIWDTQVGRLMFGEQIPSHSEKCFRVVYKEQTRAAKVRRSWRFEISVAARRTLSEFRDDYISRSRFLSATAGKLKGALKKAI